MTKDEKKLICEYCGINFKLKKTLHYHQKNSIKCLKKNKVKILLYITTKFKKTSTNKKMFKISNSITRI